MDMLMALAVSIGVLIALWVQGRADGEPRVPAGIVAWPCFRRRRQDTRIAEDDSVHLSGVVWVWLAMTLIGMMNMVLRLGDHPAGRFHPGDPVEAAGPILYPRGVLWCSGHAWAAPADPKGYLMVAVALVRGRLLGYVSEMGAGMIAKKA